MQKRTETKAEEAPVNSTAGKKPYHRPSLRVYGSVSSLTKSGSSGPNEHSGQFPAMSASDPITKTNIVRIDTHPLGIGLYLFDYKSEFRGTWGHGRQFGVMADEVETIMPAAVSLHPSGYKQVDYTMLGIYRVLH